MRSLLTAISVSLLIVTSVAAAPPAKQDRNKPKGEQSEVKQLYGLDWYTKLDPALKKAGEKTGSEKPVMVLRVLGELDGFM